MRNKWASCSTAGSLNFNNELLALDRDLADYVIVHELLHFYVPNHGRPWKSLMRAHLGDYERHEIKLQKATQAPSLNPGASWLGLFPLNLHAMREGLAAA
jgi:predicted metal-dependent hydrolase